MFKNRLRRYAGLITLITLLIAFVIFVVIANSIFDTQILQRDYFSATRTANFVQVMERIGPEDQKLRDDVRAHVSMIRDGGDLISPYGPRWYKPATTNPDIIAAIHEIERTLNANDLEAFHQAYVDFSRISAKAGFVALEELERIQYVIVIIIFIGFLGIMGLLFFRLGRADDRAMQITAEHNHILASVHDGLFLIDAHYRIGSQKSEAVRSIFGEDADISGDFFTVMSRYISEEDMELTREFVELLLDGRVKQKLMSDLNPLREVPIEATHKTGVIGRKFLNIDFTREQADANQNQILVTISDVTKEVILRQELESTKEMQKERMTMLMSILHVDPKQLSGFFEQSDTALRDINAILAREGGDHEHNPEKLRGIFRIVHQLKGDAGALGLSLFESSLHSFEDSIATMQKKTYIDGQNMLGLTVQLRDLIAEIDLVRSLAPQISTLISQQTPETTESPEAPAQTPIDFTSTLSGLPDPGNHSIEGRLRALARRAADRAGKQVDLRCSGFDLLTESNPLYKPIYEISVQLVRNSIAHGIEIPEDREIFGKLPMGKIEVRLTETNDNMQLVVRDDGRGLQYDLIREQAIKQNLLKVDSEPVKRNQLIRFIFTPGFSPAQEAGMDAGRGAGLDIVKEQIEALLGKISIKSADDKFCQFAILVPKVVGTSL